jgi:hypothetical protein
MNTLIQSQIEVELTDEQLDAISGGSWGSPWNWGANWSPNGFFGGYGYPTYPSNQTTRLNTVVQTSTFDAPQDVTNIGSYGGPVVGSSATQTQVAINS